MAAYSYRLSYGIGVKADTAGHELERIEAKYGAVTSKNVLEESRRKSAALHKCFEWDNTKAAERYRLMQAHTIINAVHVVYESDEGQIEAPAVVNISMRRCEEGSFVSHAIALADTTMRGIVLSRALNELKTFKEKYASLQELSKVIEAVDKVEEEYVNAV